VRLFVLYGCAQNISITLTLGEEQQAEKEEEEVEERNRRCSERQYIDY
jgi:hypothetical protein